MAIDKKGLGVVLAGIAVGAAQYLKKPENREKAMDMLNQSKTKLNGLMDQGKGAAQQFNSSEGTLKEKVQDVTAQFKGGATNTHTDLPVEDVDTSHAAKFSEDRMVNEGPQDPSQYFNATNEATKTETNHTRHTDM
ncbi:MAG: hypothetical protein KIG60_00270 [Caryophanon sp.]|nr:hypothetical protein [Caryophanon sp.]